jgi:hypothetical protein
MSLESFSEPAGILTAINTGAIIVGSVWLYKKTSQVEVIYEEIKKHTDELVKIKDTIKNTDGGSLHKIETLIVGINNISHKLNHYIMTSEEKNIVRDRKIDMLCRYMEKNEPSQENISRQNTHFENNEDEDDDDDVAKIIRMASTQN